MRYPHVRVNQAYRVTNPTFGTGIIQNNDQAFAATKPLLLVFNGDAAGGVSIYLDYIKLINAAAGGSASSAHLAMILDTVDRYSAGGSRLTTTPGAVNPNSGLAVTAKARIDFGAVTAIAASAARQIARDMVKTQAAPCWTVGDEVYVKFDTLDFSPALSSGAGTAIFGVPSGPVIIGPGHSFLLYLWHPAVVTAPQWEIEMAWWEDKS